MTSPSTKLVHFTQFKKNVYGGALAILEKIDPEYVQYMQAHLQNPDPASVAKTRPTKALPKKCQTALDALVSYELEMEQVKMCLKFLGRPCPLSDSVCTQGQWAVFFVDAWMNLAYSWQKKLNLLVKRVCSWKELDPQISNSIVSGLKPFGTKFNEIRGRYVHETGAVPGISEGPGWELPVVLGMDVATHPYVRLHTSAINKQQDWSDRLAASTVKILANLEAFFEQLNKRIFPS